MADKYTTTRDAPSATTTPESAATGTTRSSKEDMKNQARETVDQAKNEAKAHVEQTKQEARTQFNEVAEEAKARGQQMLDEQRSAALGHLDKIASALRDTANNLRSQNEETAGRVVEQAASGLDRFSQRMRSEDPQALMRQVTDSARRHPAMFIGGAIAAGFLVSRFLKASDDHASYGQDADMRSGMSGGTSESYVTSAHANPDEVVAGRAGLPPEMPTGRRNY